MFCNRKYGRKVKKDEEEGATRAAGLFRGVGSKCKLEGTEVDSGYKHRQLRCPWGAVEMGVSSAMELVDSLFPLLRYLSAMGRLLKYGQTVWWAVQDTRERLGSNIP